MPNLLTIIQINEHRSHNVAGEVAKAAVDKKADFLILQEPATRRGTLAGTVAGSRYVCRDNLQDPPLAAVTTVGQPSSALGMVQWTNRNMAVLRSEEQDITLVSAYCPIGEPMEVTTDHLEHILNGCRRRVIIGMDANAWHTAWAPQDVTPEATR